MKKQLVLSASLFCFFSYVLFCMLPQGTVIKEGDAKGYYHSAQLFAYSNKVFLINEVPPVGPGYSVVLGTLFKIFGDHIVIVIIFNVFLTVLILGLLASMAHRMFGRYAALFVCVTFPLHVGFLTYTQCALTEVFLALLYLVFLDRFLRFIEDPTDTVLLLQAGLILGISVIVKPAAWFYGLLVLAAGLLLGVYKKDLVPVFFFGISFLGVALSYLSYNWYMFNAFAFPGVMERNFLTLYLPKLFAQVHKQSFTQAYETIFVMPYQERWMLLSHLVKNNPLLAGKIWIANVIKTGGGLFVHHLHLLVSSGVKMGQSFFDIQDTFSGALNQYLFGSSSSLLFHLFAVGELFIMLARPLLCFVCGIFYYRQSKYGHLFFMSSFILYFLFITGADGCARLRMTIEPLLLLMSAGGFSILCGYVIQIHKLKKLYSGEPV